MNKPKQAEIFYVVMAEIKPGRWDITSEAVSKSEATLLVRDEWKKKRRARMVSSE